MRTRLTRQGVNRIYYKEANIVSKRIPIVSIIRNLSIEVQNINQVGILVEKLYYMIRRLPFTDVV